MKGIAESDKKFKLKKGTGLVIFGIVIFAIGYIISDAGQSYSMVTFLMIYLIGIPAFLIGIPIMINEKFSKFSYNLTLFTGITLIVVYGIFMLYTLTNH